MVRHPKAEAGVPLARKLMNRLVRRICMICPHCQSPVADGVKFCGSCGRPLTGTTPPPQPAGYAPQPQSQYGAPQQPQPNIYVPPNQYEEYTSNEVLGGSVP